MSARTALAASGLAIILGLTACGGGAGRGVSDAAAGPLAERVAAVRVAAGRDRGQALLQLNALRQEVARFQDDAALTAAAATRILTAADEVEDGLGGLAAAEPTTTTTAPPPTTTAPPPMDDDDDDGDKGRGKGRGDDD